MCKISLRKDFNTSGKNISCLKRKVLIFCTVLNIFWLLKGLDIFKIILLEVLCTHPLFHLINVTDIDVFIVTIFFMFTIPN